MVFRGAFNHTVQLNIVTLENNTAQYGGGFFIYFLEGATNNTFSIDGAKVIGNKAFIVDITCIGGEALIAVAASYEPLCPGDNTITITSSTFIANEADTGGGGIMGSR